VAGGDDRRGEDDAVCTDAGGTESGGTEAGCAISFVMWCCAFFTGLMRFRLRRYLLPLASMSYVLFAVWLITVPCFHTFVLSMGCRRTVWPGLRVERVVLFLFIGSVLDAV
jgi:hypothetical protein